MKIIGVTGGVGAGKSTIMNYLKEKHHVAVVLADKVGHELMAPDGKCYGQILELFGEEICCADRTIDRRKVAALVFQNEKKLKKLNRIIHPAVKQEILARLSAEEEKGTKWFAIEAALFLEDHYDEICDDLWYIYVDEKIRRERLKKERGYSDEKITGIIHNQLSDTIFRQHCNCVIENNGNLEVTYRQIDERLKNL